MAALHHADRRPRPAAAAVSSRWRAFGSAQAAVRLLAAAPAAACSYSALHALPASIEEPEMKFRQAPGLLTLSTGLVATLAVVVIAFTSPAEAAPAPAALNPATPLPR
jgi:hypothetical protein